MAPTQARLAASPSNPSRMTSSVPFGLEAEFEFLTKPEQLMFFSESDHQRVLAAAIAQ